jgi:hypothetical protein
MDGVGSLLSWTPHSDIDLAAGGVQELHQAVTLGAVGTVAFRLFAGKRRVAYAVLSGVKSLPQPPSSTAAVCGQERSRRFG